MENNKRIAQIFNEIAMMLSILGDNPFRIRAYEKAALNIEGLPEDVSVLIEKGKLTSIPGIGKDLESKIKSYLERGKIQQYEELKKKVPPGVLQMMNIPSIGPKTAKLLFERLKIDSMDKLEKYALEGKLTKLQGVREKTVENILKGIQLIKKGKERMPLYKALEISELFMGHLKKIEGTGKIETGGSVRRRKDTIRDVDILVVSRKPQKIMDAFVKFREVKEILAHGPTKSSILTRDDVQVDLRVVEEKSFGAALLYFTGSKAFNIKLRLLSQKEGYKINEYGVFRTKGKKEKYVCGKTEEEIFKFFRLQYVPPQAREDRGEIELALKNKLPEFVALKNVQGDFHVHSNYSDGEYSIEEVASYAKKLGYKYVAIADHSRSLRIAGGLSIDQIHKKINEIKKLNRKMTNFTILCAQEVDILQDGKLDYPDKILKQLDIVIAAVHTGFKQSREKLTSRIKKAAENKYTDIIAHPTGRLWETRGPYDLDMEGIFKTCKKNRTALEINCFPNRMDLDSQNAFAAREAGVTLSLGTDAHVLGHMHYMGLGVDLACRAWGTKKDVLNCWSINEIKNWRKKRGV